MVDFLPTGLTLADAGWTQSGATATFNTPLSIGAGQSQVIQIAFTVDDGYSGGSQNAVEITDADDENGVPADDIDSTDDSLNGNDTIVNDEIDGAGGDEDDQDIEDLVVERFDIALIKTVNPCLLYTSPSPRDQRGSRMPSSA